MTRWICLLVLTLLAINLNAQNSISFLDISRSAGIDFSGENIGIAFADYDQDGDQDAYISVRDGANKLLRNDGQLRFTEVASQAGVNYAGSSRTSAFGDLNNDGFPELYVGNFEEPDLLYLNNGDGTFTDITAAAGINSPGKAFSVNFCDLNQDGLLDIYVANFRTQNIVYKNLGNNQFEDNTLFARAFSEYNAMGAIFFDYDNDGDQDLYLVHDGQPNMLYNNIGPGKFVNLARIAKVDYQGFGMGVDVADVNKDGWLDIYITNLYENVLFLNNQNGTFTNVSESASVDDNGMAWGTNFLDYNNDGKTDIYVTNDSYFSPYPNVLYQNQGGVQFTKTAENEPLSSMQGGYGSAFADLDEDGFLDLMVANAGRNDNLQLFHNQMQEGNWISLKLEGVKSNRDAVGARIHLWDNLGNYHMDEVNSGSGYASQNSQVMHFGLGEAERIDSAFIRWSGGRIQQFDLPDINTFYHLKEGNQPTALNTITNNIEQLAPRLNWSIFPNPTNKDLELQIVDLSSDAQISIVNALGQTVFEQAVNNASFHQQTLNLSNLQKGLYFIQLRSEGELWSKRFIKNH